MYSNGEDQNRMNHTANTSNGSHELVRDSIYTALLQLMDQTSFDKISITDIVRRAGVSRMAYYRNYQSKEEILLSRLTDTLEGFEAKLRDYGNITEVEFWREFFEAFRQDPVIRYIVDAGLVKPLMEAHKNFTIRMYQKIFHWDMSDPHNRMLIYQRMGSMVGLMLYNIESENPADPGSLARQIVGIAREDEKK